MTTDRTYLNTRTRFLLTQKIHTEYAKSGLTDIEFAKKAETDLGFPVTAGHITYIRREFQIPVNNNLGGGSTRAATIVRLEALEKRVEELEAHIETLLRERKQNHIHTMPLRT
jgi:hypothetical protein